MSRMSFGDAEYAGKEKRTQREVFLAEMDQVIPWGSLLRLIEPVYPIGGRGRQPGNKGDGGISAKRRDTSRY